MRPARPEMACAIVILVVCLAFIASFTVPVPGIVRALLGTLIILDLTGLSLRAFLRVVSRPASPRPLWTPAGIASDLFGSLSLLVLPTMALAISFHLDEGTLLGAILGPCMGLSGGTLLLAWRLPPPIPKRVRTPRQVGAAIFLLFAAASGLFIVFRWPNPYPSISGWDLNATLASVGWILSHHGFSYVLIPAFPASALVPYPASFNDFVAGYSLFLGVNSLSIFYYGALAMMVAYGLGVFGVAYRLTSRTSSALVAALALLFMGTALPETVRTPLFVTIDMIGQLAFLALFLLFLDDEQSLRRRRVILLLGSAFLVYWYFYEIVVLTPLLAFMLWEPARPEDAGRPLRWFRRTLLVVFAVLAVVAVTAGILLPSLESNLSADFPLPNKATALAVMYGPVVALVAVLTLMNRSRIPEDPRVRGLRPRYLLEYVAAYAAIYLLPLSATYRVEFYFRAIFAIYVATLRLPSWAEIRDAVRAASDFLRRRRLARPWHPLAAQRAGVLAVIALLVLMAVLLPTQVTQPEPYMSLDEYQTSVWIREHTPADAYIVTDPGTGYLLRAFALRNASVFFLLPDGRAPEDSSTLYPYLRSRLHFVFDAFFPNQARQEVLDLGFPDAFVVISTRTVLWSDSPAISIFDRPVSGLSPSTMLQVFAPPEFQVAFRTPTVIVLSVRP